MNVCATSARQSCGLAVEDRSGLAYDENAFRRLLTMERKRAARAERSLLVLLLKLTREPRAGDHMLPDLASLLFERLSGALREIDFIGWYRTERVIGAVLPLAKGDRTISTDAVAPVVQRVTTGLSGQLPADVARRLHIRALLLRPGGQQ